MSRGKSQSAVDKIPPDVKALISRQQSIFLLCDMCHWCTTYLDKARLPTDNKCQQCSNIEMLSSFPVLPNESFTFDYNEKRGVELEFKPRKTRDK
jgi:hypothetical protein